ncbi:NAD(P)-dependent oxidoreductase [Tsukamurella pulmonis]|uniref:dTDP-4-dehydrorhamnose reductase n=2 Tax=Tsukamurella pulmonis TaxID=47312 RepID=A0A1H1GUC8_9ACTN|nr:dTDP-4-dehydrorhamnose reductase [Tsukamurella pulmonis]KXO88248.1 NAD(P)-dependent oxidoreductase [Tsukamurella pulmonis]SDR16673.1 dTDP-4-dehydrorhamnose reductase [Tsukamurella pulmonis]SUP16613.1 dTDP-4-dehydrorhamnose reductase [Tsukamurella pulmonis]
MELVVTGAAGQVGSALVAAAAARGIATRALGRAQLDVTSPQSVAGLALGPSTVLVNCAAHTAVDAAESEPDAAADLNAAAPALLAQRCAATGARLVQVSTDYVFGPAPEPPRPWEPTDPTGPAGVYGRTKLAGEEAARAADPRTVVVRTAWVYTGRAPGPDGTDGWARDFVGTMGRLADGGVDPNVVDDQTGSPTYAPDLASGLLDLAVLLGEEPERPGAVLHAAGGGSATWFDLARGVFARTGADPARVTPCTTDEFPRPAPRPAYSVLSPAAWAAWGLAPLPDWDDALDRALRRAVGGPAPRDR